MPAVTVSTMIVFGPAATGSKAVKAVESKVARAARAAVKVRVSDTA